MRLANTLGISAEATRGSLQLRAELANARAQERRAWYAAALTNDGAKRIWQKCMELTTLVAEAQAAEQEQVLDLKNQLASSQAAQQELLKREQILKRCLKRSLRSYGFRAVRQRQRFKERLANVRAVAQIEEERARERERERGRERERE